MKASIYVYDGIKNIDKTREYAAQLDVWDAKYDDFWGDMVWVRQKIQEEFPGAVVVREFRPARDAVEYTTYLLMLGNTVRIDFDMEIESEDKRLTFKDPASAVPTIRRLLEEIQ